MLLKALHEFAQSNHLLGDQAFTDRPVRWCISINAEGKLVGNGLIDTSDREHTTGVSMSAPRTIRAKGTGDVAEFLADGLTSVFGFDVDPDRLDAETPSRRSTRIENNAAKFQNYWNQIEDAYRHTASPLARAMLSFKQRYAVQSEQGTVIPLPCMRWGLSASAKPTEKLRWWIKRSGGDETPMGRGDTFTFQVDGRTVLADGRLREYWSRASQAERDQRNATAARGTCLVTGQTNVPIAHSHPTIKGVRGGLTAGSYLVSFSAKAAGDVCSFASFGWQKGENARISQAAADGYASALSKMLADDNNHIVIGPTTLCFWAKQHADFSAGIAALLRTPLSETVTAFFRQWLGGANDRTLESDHFCAVALSGNVGRIVVRDWIDQPLAKAAANMKSWFDDLTLRHIPPRSAKKTSKSKERQEVLFLAVFHLACALVRDPKNLPGDAVAQIYRAALEGRPLSATLLKPLLHRFRCDLVKRDQAYPFNPSRFALLKLILTRLPKTKEDSFMPKEQLITDTDDAAYNLGRLLAVLEALQRKAHEYQLEGAGVIERYYGAASSAPASVFPLLCRLARHHIRKLEKLGEKGKRDAHYIEDEMAGILARIKPDAAAAGVPPTFPRYLSLEKQGRFALGFYQQKAYTAQAIAEAKATRDGQ